jgi:hypothetical protein
MKKKYFFVLVAVAVAFSFGALSPTPLLLPQAHSFSPNPPPPPPPPPPGDEGCTPGYWKNHTDAWVGLSPGTPFDSLFGSGPWGDINLLEALNMKGNKNKWEALVRHATAAALNCNHPDVAYPLTMEQILGAVNSRNKAILEYNNEMGCPL